MKPTSKILTTSCLLSALWLAAGTVSAATLADLMATRTDADDSHSDLLLRWSSADTALALDIYALPEPDMSVAGMAAVASSIAASEGNWQTDDFDGERPYFVLTRAGSTEVLATVAERLLPLEGGRNFRDLGGYATEDGRSVKWGSIYRSGVMNALTDNDYAYLDQLGIKVLCDFRATEERTEEPTVWKAGEPLYLSWDYASDDSSAELRELLGSGATDHMLAQATMQRLYPQLLEQHKDKFKVMFEQLANGNAPLAFNCSAGKDRTGVAAALLLTALGVPRATVVHDYSLSDDYVDYMAEFAGNMDKDGPYAYLASLPREFLVAMMASDPSYIEAAFEYIDTTYGSVDAFIETELQVSPSQLEAIRNLLLTQ